jgi:hypothetical protein
MKKGDIKQVLKEDCVYCGVQARLALFFFSLGHEDILRIRPTISGASVKSMSLKTSKSQGIFFSINLVENSSLEV